MNTKIPTTENRIKSYFDTELEIQSPKLEFKLEKWDRSQEENVLSNGLSNGQASIQGSPSTPDSRISTVSSVTTKDSNIASGVIQNLGSWISTTGSGASWTPQWQWNNLTTHPETLEDANKSDSKYLSDFKDLASEIEDKLHECDSKIDEIFEEMKSDRKKTPILNPVFQYYAGMRLGLESALEKINKYIKMSLGGEPGDSIEES